MIGAAETTAREAARRAILEIRFGPDARKRTVLDPGRTLRVGRTELADLVIPGDETLASVHFELEWNGSRCLLRDVSRMPTKLLLAGEAVSQSEVPNGAWIRAGSTDFSVYLEEHTPPPWGSETFASEAAREHALGVLRAEAERGVLYALLDAARDERIPVILREAVDEQDSLYQGLTAETMAEVAPYIVKLKADSRLLSQLVREGWGGAWGVFLASDAPLREVRAHLRRLLFVSSEEDAEVRYFRFYDPRVLRVFVPTCTVRQEHELYGPIQYFLCEDELGGVQRIERAPARGEA